MTEREILDILNNQVEMIVAKIIETVSESRVADSHEELLDKLETIAESVAVLGKLVRDAREEANSDT